MIFSILLLVFNLLYLLIHQTSCFSFWWFLLFFPLELFIEFILWLTMIGVFAGLVKRYT